MRVAVGEKRDAKRMVAVATNVLIVLSNIAAMKAYFLRGEEGGIVRAPR